MATQLRNRPAEMRAGRELPDLLDAETIYRKLGIGRSTFERLLASGKFPKPQWVGRQRRWTAEAVADWIERQSKPAYN